jgi:SpoVK/Ycf46/Vps4 family AAA+-type ATPase
MLAEALANEANAELWKIQSTDIYGKWLGQSGDRIKKIFEKAKVLDKPTIILFDEIDTIISTVGNPGAGGAGQERNSVAGIFKQEMQILSRVNPNVLVIATTNNLDQIDPALIRSGRFDHIISVPLPDQQARQEIILNSLARIMASVHEDTFDLQLFAEDFNVQEIAVLTDGMNGADIAEIFRRTVHKRAMQEVRNPGAILPPIGQADIIAAIQSFHREG